jgi:Protein of unknown function (DUF1761)
VLILNKNVSLLKFLTMHFNIWVVVASGLIPLLTGFTWYNPKAFGTAWLKSIGMTEEQMQADSPNMGKIFGLTALFGVMLAFAVTQLVIHQSHYYSILANTPEMKDPSSTISISTKAFMEMYGQNFRTFKHGAFHGALSALFIVLPVFGVNALFERKSWTYIWVHVGYWALTLALMGGVISAFA